MDDFRDQIVLVVDDSPMNREIYKELISRSLNCRVEVAPGKNSALDRIKRAPVPALVLLDVGLPNPEDGLEVCQRIKQGEFRPEIQVVMISAIFTLHDVNILKGCLEAGADDFIIRDAKMEEIKLRIGNKLRFQKMSLEYVAALRKIMWLMLLEEYGFPPRPQESQPSSMQYDERMVDMNVDERIDCISVRELLSEVKPRVDQRVLPSTLEIIDSNFTGNVFAPRKTLADVIDLITQDIAGTHYKLTHQGVDIIISSDRVKSNDRDVIRILFSDSGSMQFPVDDLRSIKFAREHLVGPEIHINTHPDFTNNIRVSIDLPLAG